jgi:hypothetical protein
MVVRLAGRAIGCLTNSQLLPAPRTRAEIEYETSGRA